MAIKYFEVKCQVTSSALLLPHFCAAPGLSSLYLASPLSCLRCEGGGATVGCCWEPGGGLTALLATYFLLAVSQGCDCCWITLSSATLSFGPLM